MRAVIDTNVLVSGLLNPHGPPGRLVDAVLNGAITVLFDDRILDEYREVLARDAFGFAAGDVRVVLDFIEAAGEAVSALPVAVSLPDADDLPFLEVAIAGRADVLVTGNVRHFKAVTGRHGVVVLGPAAVVKRLATPE